jgi:hypothetical protein
MAEPLTERELVEILEEMIRDRLTPPRVKVECVRQWRMLRVDPEPGGFVDTPISALAKLDEVGQRCGSRGRPGPRPGPKA